MNTWRPFNRATVDLHAPHRSGVYAIKRGGRVIYVGQSLNVHDRLCDHLTGTSNPILARLLYAAQTSFLVREVAPIHLNVVERAWISELQPICNRRVA